MTETIEPKTKDITGMTQFVLKQLLEKGLLFLILALAVVYLAKRDAENNDLILRENAFLKTRIEALAVENKEIGTLFYGDVAIKLGVLISNQEKILYQLPNKKGGHYEKE